MRIKCWATYADCLRIARQWTLTLTQSQGLSNIFRSGNSMKIHLCIDKEIHSNWLYRTALTASDSPVGATQSRILINTLVNLMLYNPNAKLQKRFNSTEPAKSQIQQRDRNSKFWCQVIFLRSTEYINWHRITFRCWVLTSSLVLVLLT